MKYINYMGYHWNETDINLEAIEKETRSVDFVSIRFC